MPIKTTITVDKIIDRLLLGLSSLLLIFVGVIYWDDGNFWSKIDEDKAFAVFCDDYVYFIKTNTAEAPIGTFEELLSIMKGACPDGRIHYAKYWSTLLTAKGYTYAKCFPANANFPLVWENNDRQAKSVILFKSGTIEWNK